MTKLNDKKKQPLKKITTATALTITLATPNVSTLSYGMELENDINKEIIVEEQVVEEEIVTEEEEQKRKNAEMQKLPLMTV